MIWSFTHLKYQHHSTDDDFIYSSGIILLVPFFATREAVALLVNNLIMSSTLKQSFRHLEHQNLSIISEDIGRARMVQQLQRRRSRRSTVDTMSTDIEGLIPSCDLKAFKHFHYRLQYCNLSLTP